MSETPATFDQAPPLVLDSVYNTIQKIGQDVQIVPASQLPESAITYTFANFEREPGVFDPYAVRLHNEHGGLVSATTLPQQTQDQLLQAASASLRIDGTAIRYIANQEGRWWINDTPGINQEIEHAVETHLTEALRIHGMADEHIDILNATPTSFTEPAVAALETAVQNAAHASGNKLYGAVKGLVFVPKATLVTPERPDKLGHVRDGIVVLSEELLQPGALSSHPSFKRYAPYFAVDPNGFDPLTVVLTHEFGHVLDSRERDETGMRHELPTTEEPPTVYAKTHTNEDYAETFTILAMGGNVEQLPLRSKTVLQTIHEAAGELHHGPHKVTTERIIDQSQFVTNPIDAVGVNLVYVPIANEAAA